MRSIAPILPLIALLSGCAQVFESNLFQTIDAPPPVTASGMGKTSAADVKSQLADPNTATAFYQQLQDNPTALASLQTNLQTQITAASTPAAKVDIAQTLILVTANGDAGVKNMVNNAITQASNLQSGGTPADAVKALVAGKTEPEIEALLNQFQTMQNTFLTMQTASIDGTGHAVNSALFYGAASSATKGDLAQMALVAAAADAMIKDNADIATLAPLLFAGSALSATTTNMDNVSSALDGSNVDPTTNDYAYLSCVTGIVPF